MTKTNLLIFAFSLTTAVSCLASDRTQGAYAVTAVGFASGKGTASVSKKSVTFSIKIEDDNGNKGTLHAANIPLVDGRFTGTGTVLSINVTITGRVDPPDQDGPIRSARIVATFTDGNGMAGRIAGFIRSKKN